MYAELGTASVQQRNRRPGPHYQPRMMLVEPAPSERIGPIAKRADLGFEHAGQRERADLTRCAVLLGAALPPHTLKNVPNPLVFYS